MELLPGPTAPVVAHPTAGRQRGGGGERERRKPRASEVEVVIRSRKRKRRGKWVEPQPWGGASNLWWK